MKTTYGQKSLPVTEMLIRIKRVYEPPEESDGKRILIDRLWPRGLTKDKAKVDLWIKDISPSTGLRKWFGHDPAKWPEFQKRYQKELDANEPVVSKLRNELEEGSATLVYGAKDEEHNDAVVLRYYLNK
jgi:uncharacterized protein YeaO (DUF488 family)